MPVPLICLDACLRQFAAVSQACFSRPQHKYFVTVLLALVLCQEPRTLSGLLRQVADAPSLAGTSRFLSQAPWSADALPPTRLTRFHAQLALPVRAEHERQRSTRPKRRGRRRATVVTGYLMGDDSMLHKPKGKQMDGLGRHDATSQGKRVSGHSLVLGLYVLLGRRCPRAPQM
jgi:hypothetical protein